AASVAQPLAVRLGERDDRADPVQRTVTEVGDVEGGRAAAVPPGDPDGVEQLGVVRARDWVPVAEQAVLAERAGGVGQNDPGREQRWVRGAAARTAADDLARTNLDVRVLDEVLQPAAELDGKVGRISEQLGDEHLLL